MFKSATVKLTLWYVLLMMGFSILFSGVLYRLSTHELAEALHNQYRVLVTDDHDGDNQSNVTTQELDARSQHLVQDLIYFNALVLFGSTLTSYVLARRTLRPIEIAHQAQIRFTAEASHELRTPLTAMKADTEATLMEASDDPKVLRRTLEDNLQDIDKLEKLANHLLEVSRFKSRAVPGKETIDLDSVINEVVKQLGHTMRDKKLKIKIVSVPIRLVGDRQAIQQLITIVLDNAIKYSQSNAEVNLAVVKDKGATITIKDKGIGIRATDLPHIFERFYRAQNVINSDKKIAGYGLGLPLAKEIVDLHNGSIDIHSKEHKGTTVIIKLPLA